MRSSSIVSAIALCAGLGACKNDPRPITPDAPIAPPDGAIVPPDSAIVPPDAPIPPDAAPVATTLRIVSGVAPLLVVFRDGVTAPWQPATIRTATSFEAVVHGPYIVTIVCSTPDPAFGFSDILTTQSAGTPDDPHEIDVCDVPTSAHQVNGKMVQAGSVELGDEQARSATPNWSFQLTEPSGTFDLVATSSDAIAVQRNQVVNVDRTFPVIDLTLGSTPFADIAFTAPNADPAETTQVSVGLLTANNPNIPARIFLGALDVARAAPDTALIASDVQSASVRATNGPTFRALRRPIRIGGDTVYPLPPLIGGVVFSVDAGTPSVAWTSLPDLDFLFFSLGGNAHGGLTPVNYGIDMTSRFVAATGLTHIAIDTAIDGFRPEWTIDFTQFYNRDLTAQKGAELGTLTSSEVTEFIDPPMAAPGAPHARRINPVVIPRFATP